MTREDCETRTESSRVKEFGVGVSRGKGVSEKSIIFGFVPDLLEAYNVVEWGRGGGEVRSDGFNTGYAKF